MLLGGCDETAEPGSLGGEDLVLFLIDLHRNKFELSLETSLSICNMTSDFLVLLHKGEAVVLLCLNGSRSGLLSPLFPVRDSRGQHHDNLVGGLIAFV